MTEYTMANTPEPAVDAYAPPKAKAHKRRNMRRFVIYINCVTTIPCLSFVCGFEFNGVQSGVLKVSITQSIMVCCSLWY